MERKKEQQESSQSTEENISEAKNSFLRHSQLQSLGLDGVDSGTEERWKLWAVRVHFIKDVCRKNKREINRRRGQKKQNEKEALSILKCSQIVLILSPF